MIRFDLRPGADGDMLFFDRMAVKEAVDKQSRKVLSRFGAYVRRIAQKFITDRDRTSRPGESPTNQTDLLRRFIFFSYDATAKGVVIGPAKLGGRSSSNAPELLEYGGVATDSGGTHGVYIAPRPYMNPALEKSLPKLPDMWASTKFK